jgi:hypothetical protein
MNTKKTVKKEEKEFDAVEFMRERRTKIAKETEGMSLSELKKYFAQRKVKAAKYFLLAIDILSLFHPSVL